MILNNFKKALYCSSYNGSGGSSRETPISPVGLDGEIFSGNMYYSSYYLFTRIKYLPDDLAEDGDFCIAVGTNDTPVSPDDYKWENGISVLTNSGYSHKCVNKDGKYFCRFSRTFVNDTNEDITVKEVGLIMMNGLKFLAARKVLSEPVVIKAKGGIEPFGFDIG